jgi:glycine dehydrogenase subunit 2
VRIDADVSAVLERCAAEGINPGYALGRDYEEFGDGLLVALTEQRTRAQIDRLGRGPRRRGRRGALRREGGGFGMNEPVDPDRQLVDSYSASAYGDPHAHNERGPAMQTPLQRVRATTIFEKGRPGRRAFVCPDLDVPEKPLDELLPARFRRAEAPKLPEISEPEIVRHYVNLSKRNFDLDSGFYPLGSCTMKYNPRLHERVTALPGHAKLHPLQDPKRAQGALELMHGLEEALAEVSGLPHVSLQPSAGSHGELAGVLLTTAYHSDRGDTARTKVLTPDTAHGTNPATVTMAGLEVVKVGTNDDGGVDLDDLRAKADETVAASC